MEVPIDVIIENPVAKNKIVEREVYIDKKVNKGKATNIKS